MRLTKSFQRLFACTVLGLTCSAFAADDFSVWLKGQARESEARLLQNISPAGTLPGTVVAAPSKHHPDYFYHWVRDAALVMDVLVQFYRERTVGKSDLLQRLDAFVQLSYQHQQSHTPSDSIFFLGQGMGFGEPKFFVDGRPYDGDWGRPQNDGPALRAITLVHLAEALLDEGNRDYVSQKLYRAEMPARSAIKADLEFVARTWGATCFDLWEEVRGHHFYTRMVQRRAMVEGARLARRMGDDKAADYYAGVAKLIEVELLRHTRNGWIESTLDRDGGLDKKLSNLDSSTILAVLHGETNDGFMPLNDAAVKETIQRLENTFSRLYPINQNGTPGLVIGRYEEDVYSGGGLSTARRPVRAEGNGWVLVINAMAEWNFRMAAVEPQFAANYRERGDAYLRRVQLHGYPDGGLSEQVNRHTGFMQGAPDLTWSHASFLTALQAR